MSARPEALPHPNAAAERCRSVLDEIRKMDFHDFEALDLGDPDHLAERLGLADDDRVWRILGGLLEVWKLLG